MEIIIDCTISRDAAIPQSSHAEWRNLESRVRVEVLVSHCAAMLQISCLISVFVWNVAAVGDGVQPSSACVFANRTVGVPADGDVQVVKRSEVEGIACQIALGAFQILGIYDMSTVSFKITEPFVSTQLSLT